MKESFCFSLLDLEILSAELQYKIEKYKLEMINLQQNIKRCKDTASKGKTVKREKSLFSILDSINRKSGRIHSKVITSSLKPHQLDLFERRLVFFSIYNCVPINSQLTAPMINYCLFSALMVCWCPRWT